MTVVAVLCTLASFVPEIFFLLVALVHVLQVLFPIFLIWSTILFAKQRETYLDFQNNKHLKGMVRAWFLSLVISFLSWLVFLTVLLPAL